MSHGGHEHAAGENLRLAFLLNLGFTVIEVAGGVWTNSIAIISDALHDAGDCFSLGLAWYLQRLSQRRRMPASPTAIAASPPWARSSPASCS